MKINFVRLEYPLVFPFKLSYGTYHQRTGMIITILEEKNTGYGELSLVPYYGKDESLIVEQIKKVAQYLEDRKGDWTPEILYEEIRSVFKPDPVVQSAFDCALYDLYGKKEEQPIWQLVGGRQSVEVESSLTITADDWKEKLDWGWPVLKLKMGFPGDIELLKSIRMKYDGPLRIDANAGWTLEDLQNNKDALVEAGVEMVEQPLKPTEDFKLEDLNYPLPLMADESVQEIEFLDKASGIYQGVNIKLQKCGGITPALQMIRKARKTGLKLMAGCMTESSVGIGAMVQLASFFDYLDLDSEYLIRYDFGAENYAEKGRIILTEKPGLGQDFDI